MSVCMFIFKHKRFLITNCGTENAAVEYVIQAGVENAGEEKARVYSRVDVQ